MNTEDKKEILNDLYKWAVGTLKLDKEKTGEYLSEGYLEYVTDHKTGKQRIVLSEKAKHELKDQLKDKASSSLAKEEKSNTDKIIALTVFALVIISTIAYEYFGK